MPAPSLSIRFEVRHFPPGFANFGGPRNVISKLLTDNAMLRVGLPVPVERELDEGAKARLAFAQLFLRPPQLRDVLENAKLAHRPFGIVPRHVALTVDYSLGAIG